MPSRRTSARELRLKVIELNRRRNRVILSERAALQEWRTQQKDRLLSELEEGEIRSGRITSIRNFGVFVDLGGADGLAHLSELSWDRNRAPEELFHVGDEVDVYVMKVDSESKKIALIHPPRPAGAVGRDRRQVPASGSSWPARSPSSSRSAPSRGSMGRSRA